MLCLCAVYSAVAVTCVQRHEHRSTMCAKLVADSLLFVCLFVYLFIYLFLEGGPSTNGRFNQYCVWMGSRLDGGSRGGSGMSREGHGCRCPSPFLPPPFLEGPPLRATKPKPRCRIKGSNTCSRSDLGMVAGVGV